MDVFVRPRAEADLSELLGYLRAESEAVADRLRDDFATAVRLIGEYPEIGHVRTDVPTEFAHVRFVSMRRFRNHLIAYEVRTDRVHIVRILHGARDMPTQSLE